MVEYVFANEGVGMVGMDDETRRLIDASCRMYVSVPFIELIQGKRPVMHYRSISREKEN